MFEKVTEIIMHGLVLLIAFPIHECSHAITAHWLGDDTAKDEGRITLNPLKHLDPMGTIFMLIAGFGWARAVPIDPRNFKNPKVGMAISSFAGPVSNLILAYLSMIAYKITAYCSLVDEKGYITALSTIFVYSVILNVGLAVFNLLPIPPLDGSRVVTLILPQKLYFNIMKYENIIFGIFFVIIFLGLLDKPLSIMQTKVLECMDIMTGWVDIIMLMIMR